LLKKQRGKNKERQSVIKKDQLRKKVKLQLKKKLLIDMEKGILKSLRALLQTKLKIIAIQLVKILKK